MAYRIIATCDKCKKETIQDGKYFSERSAGWQEVKFEISQYEHKTYLFCGDCRKSLGLVKDDPKSTVRIETVADRLFECITEIAAEVQHG